MVLCVYSDQLIVPAFPVSVSTLRLNHLLPFHSFRYGSLWLKTVRSSCVTLLSSSFCPRQSRRCHSFSSSSSSSSASSSSTWRHFGSAGPIVSVLYKRWSAINSTLATESVTHVWECFNGIVTVFFRINFFIWTCLFLSVKSTWTRSAGRSTLTPLPLPRWRRRRRRPLTPLLAPTSPRPRRKFRPAAKTITSRGKNDRMHYCSYPALKYILELHLAYWKFNSRFQSFFSRTGFYRTFPPSSPSWRRWPSWFGPVSIRQATYPVAFFLDRF